MSLTDEAVGAALAKVIGGGVVPREDLRGLLAAAGTRISFDEIDEHLQFNTAFAELEDGVVYLPGLTEGVGFGLWVDPATATENYLPMHPAVEAISWWLIQSPVDLFDEAGKSIGQIQGDGWMIDGVDTDVIVGPDGWLDDVADSWIALRVREGELVLERLAGPPTVDPAMSTVVRAAFDAVAVHHTYQPIGAEESVDVARAPWSEVQLDALIADTLCFRGEPIAVEKLLAAAGLRSNGYWVVPSDLDPEIVAAAQREITSMSRWGVDADEAVSAQMLLGAMSLHAAGDPKAFGDQPEERQMATILFAGLLQREPVAMAIGYECAEIDDASDALAFAEEICAILGDLGDDERLWGPVWLAAHSHLVLGDVDAAAALLDSLPTTIDSLPVLVARATIAADRSQVREARSLVLAAERKAEDVGGNSMVSYHFQKQVEALVDEVETWASTAPSSKVRRNDPCPCASGRKYKACHLGRELQPIEDRAGWLYQKMVRFTRGQRSFEIDELAMLMADATDSSESWLHLRDFPFIPDVVLHEEQFAQIFLDGRQSTLPPDEILVAQQWTLVNRSVFEVETSRPGHLGLRDLATGDEVTVSNIGSEPGHEPAPGSIVVGRPLPVGDTYRAFSGFMSLRPDQVREALSVLDDGNPDDLVALLGSVLRAPTIRNTDGHDMELCDISWSIADTTAVAAGLKRAGLTSDNDTEDDTWTLVRDTANQSNAVVASLHVENDQLIGHVNSMERAGELLGLIGEHVPGAKALGIETVDIDDIDLTDRTPSKSQDELMAIPEVQALLEEQMANYEAEWLDSSIPALGDLTPRQAAADPIAREELIRLLASFPEPPEGTPGMSSRRLSDALGL